MRCSKRIASCGVALIVNKAKPNTHTNNLCFINSPLAESNCYLSGCKRLYFSQDSLFQMHLL